MGECTRWACKGGANGRTNEQSELAARWGAALPCKSGGGALRRSPDDGEGRRSETQADGKGDNRRGKEAAGMDHFLAKPALVERILGLERRGTGLAQSNGFDGGGRETRMDMGLDRQALQKESQQDEGRHPFAGRG